jgi:phage terminase large subunit-like protein
MKYLKIFEQNSEKWTFNKIDDLYNDKSDMASLILRYLVFNNLDRFAYHYDIDEYFLLCF